MAFLVARVLKTHDIVSKKGKGRRRLYHDMFFITDLIAKGMHCSIGFVSPEIANA